MYRFLVAVSEAKDFDVQVARDGRKFEVVATQDERTASLRVEAIERDGRVGLVSRFRAWSIVDLAASDDPDGAVQSAVMKFLNGVPSGEPEALVARIIDDPIFHKPLTVLPTAVAEEILRDRQTRYGGKFTSIREVSEIRGVGVDSLHNILYTFWNVDHRALQAGVLEFFNDAALAAQTITERIQNDPNFGKSTAQIPPSVAQRILDDRLSQGGQFGSIRDVFGVRGHGPTHVHNILYTFWKFLGQLRREQHRDEEALALNVGVSAPKGVTMGSPMKPCENCGSSHFLQGTDAKVKGALTRVFVGGARLKFKPDSGTPVDIHVCTKCRLVRLFAVTK